MKRKHSIFDCHIIQFPKIHNGAGNITAIQNKTEIPFDIKRFYYLYDVPGGETRGAHAHKQLEQVIIAASGSFDVMIDDGRSKKIVSLNRPYFGLHLYPGMWRDISNFSSGAICLALASEVYDEKDYIRSYDDFIAFTNN
ncbi:MAG: FdtA/QdtA family cupin domain-containing protein [Segetibacter sp.]